MQSNRSWNLRRTQSLRARLKARNRPLCWAVGLLFLLLFGIKVIKSFDSRSFSLQIKQGSSSLHHRAYTIRVNTFRRNDLLRSFVRHFSTCPNVHAIHVVWSDQDNPPPPLSFLSLATSSVQVPVSFEQHATDSLNNRFRNLSIIETDAVLSLDDDVKIKCEDLDFAHTVWQSSPHSLVGFAPRLITWDQKRRTYVYQSSFKVVWWHGLYNIVLTKCCFLHREFLPTYFRTLSPETLSYIDKQRNCEDIAMQFVVSNATGGAPPVWVRGPVQDAGTKSGISQGRDHQQERSACAARLVAEFGHLPLTVTSQKALDGRKQWIW